VISANGNQGSSFVSCGGQCWSGEQAMIVTQVLIGLVVVEGVQVWGCRVVCMYP